MNCGVVDCDAGIRQINFADAEEISETGAVLQRTIEKCKTATLCNSIHNVGDPLIAARAHRKYSGKDGNGDEYSSEGKLHRTISRSKE